MRVYNDCKTGSAAVCDRCGQRRYNRARVIRHGRCVADRDVAERRRKIDIEEFVVWQVRANLEAYIASDADVVRRAIAQFAEWDGLRICSDCENTLYDAVKALLES